MILLNFINETEDAIFSSLVLCAFGPFCGLNFGRVECNSNNR